MTIDTTEYRFSHGKDPKGHGMWMFEFKKSNGGTYQTGFAGNFGQAKKAALAYARTVAGCWKVVVCP